MGDPAMAFVTEAEIQNNFDKYLQAVEQGKEFIILKDGKPAARLIPEKQNAAFLADSLLGVLQRDYDDKEIAEERRKHVVSRG